MSQNDSVFIFSFLSSITILVKVHTSVRTSLLVNSFSSKACALYLYVPCRTVCKETSFVLPDCTALTSRIPCMHREQTAVESHRGVFVLREIPSAQTGVCSGLQLRQVGTCFEQTYGVPDSVPSDSLCWRKGN